LSGSPTLPQSASVKHLKSVSYPCQRHLAKITQAGIIVRPLLKVKLTALEIKYLSVVILNNVLYRDLGQLAVCLINGLLHVIFL
jgi:hypothetical protein